MLLSVNKLLMLLGGIMRFKADKWRGVWIITDDGNPRSVNGLRMSECGQTVDRNLNIWKAYEDSRGCSDVRCYPSSDAALRVAISLNEQYQERLQMEEDERLEKKRIQQEAQQKKAKEKQKRIALKKAEKEKRKKERRDFILECLRIIFKRKSV